MSAPVITLGLGLRARATAATLQALWQHAQSLLPSPRHLSCIATLPRHQPHPALRQWLADCHPTLPLLAAPPQALPAQPTHSQSPQALARYGCGSVAEACALWAARQMHPAATPQLLLPRLIAPDGSATLAVACAR